MFRGRCPRPEPTLSFQNARRYPRAEVNIVVDVSLLYGPRPIKGQAIIRVLGGGGAYLEIDETCPVGELVLLRFTLPGETEAIACQGVVCNVDDGQGAGLEFLGIRPEDRERLVDFVESYLG